MRPKVYVPEITIEFLFYTCFIPVLISIPHVCPLISIKIQKQFSVYRAHSSFRGNTKLFDVRTTRQKGATCSRDENRGLAESDVNVFRFRTRPHIIRRYVIAMEWNYRANAFNVQPATKIRERCSVINEKHP